MPEGRARLFLALILLAGLGLRLTGIHWGQGYQYVAIGDEVEAYRFALDYAAGEGPGTYLGQPNVNPRAKVPGPLWSFFWLNGLRLSGSVEGLMVIVAGLNLLAAGLTFSLARRMHGTGEGLWAALFLAVMPWPVYYSVGVWNPCLLAPLGAGLFLSLWRTMTEDRSPRVFWVILILGIIPQLHMIGLTLLLPVLAVLVLGRARLHRGWLALGLLALALVYLPYLRGDSAQGWANTRGIVFGGGEGFIWESLRALSSPVMILTNFVKRWTGYTFGSYLDLGDFLAGHHAVLLFFNLLSFGLAGLFLLNFGREMKLALRPRWKSPGLALAERPAEVFTLLLLGGSLFMALAFGGAYHSRYATILLPLLFLLPARFMTWVWAGSPRRRWLLAPVAAVLAFNFVLVPGFYRLQAQKIDQPDKFIASFRQMETFRQKLLAATNREPLTLSLAGALAAEGPFGPSGRQAAALASYVNLWSERAISRPAGRPRPAFLRLERDVPPGERVVFRWKGLAVTEAGR